MSLDNIIYKVSQAGNGIQVRDLFAVTPIQIKLTEWIPQFQYILLDVLKRSEAKFIRFTFEFIYILKGHRRVIKSIVHRIEINQHFEDMVDYIIKKEVALKMRADKQPKAQIELLQARFCFKDLGEKVPEWHLDRVPLPPISEQPHQAEIVGSGNIQIFTR